MIDFGLSVEHKKSKDPYLTALVGSPFYVAPEVLNAQYGKECDLWSLGIMMFTMIAGTYPFYGRTNQELFNAIKLGKFKFDEKLWGNIS